MDNWMWAHQEMAEWQELRDAYRRRGARSVDHQAEEGSPGLGAEDALTPLQARFRRFHRSKLPHRSNSAYFVAQSALDFGSDAKEPRDRRPAFLLRFEQAHDQWLVAPMTTNIFTSEPRMKRIQHPQVGLNWTEGAIRLNKHGAFSVCRTLEYVGPIHIDRKAEDSPLFSAQDPALAVILSHVHRAVSNDLGGGYAH